MQQCSLSGIACTEPLQVLRFAPWLKKEIPEVLIDF